MTLVIAGVCVGLTLGHLINRLPEVSVIDVTTDPLEQALMAPHVVAVRPSQGRS